MSWPKKIVSSDGVTFLVEELVALQSQLLKDMIEDMEMIKDKCAITCIPLFNITSNILAKVIEYCKKHVEAPKSSDGDKSSDEDLKSFDADFVKVDKDTLFYLILAANYLNIKSLLDLTTQTAADMIKGQTPEEICKFFNLKPPTRKEAAEARRENAWAFDEENDWEFELENAWEDVWELEAEIAEVEV